MDLCRVIFLLLGDGSSGGLTLLIILERCSVLLIFLMYFLCSVSALFPLPKLIISYTKWIIQEITTQNIFHTVFKKRLHRTLPKELHEFTITVLRGKIPCAKDEVKKVPSFHPRISSPLSVWHRLILYWGFPRSIAMTALQKAHGSAFKKTLSEVNPKLLAV